MSHDPTPQAPPHGGALGLPVPAKRVDAFGKQGVYVWQKAMHVACDLPEPVRYSLSVLALYMDADGTSGRPGFARFVLARRKSDKTVRRHIEQAVAAGWLICDLRGGRDGQGVTRASTYSGALPLAVFERLDDLLSPAWGSRQEAQEVTHERPVEDSSSGHVGRPVEQDPQTPQPVISESQPVIPAASTGHPGRPTTVPSHRSTSPLSGRVPQQPEASAAPTEEREKTASGELTAAQRVVLATGMVSAEELPQCLTWLSERHKVAGMGFWHTVARNGDAPALIAEWRAATTKASPKPPCEQCDGSGWIDRDAAAFCPTCKPHLRTTNKPYPPAQRPARDEVAAGDILARIAERMQVTP